MGETYEDTGFYWAPLFGLRQGDSINKYAAGALSLLGSQTYPARSNLLENQRTYNDKNNPQYTKLNLDEESMFRKWVDQHGIPFSPDDPDPDYDMRGYFKALINGDKRAQVGINQSDNKVHFPDTWKTPKHKSFSNESIYAGKDAPRWHGNELIDKSGRVIFTEPVPENSQDIKESGLGSYQVVNGQTYHQQPVRPSDLPPDPGTYQSPKPPYNPPYAQQYSWDQLLKQGANNLLNVTR